MLFDQNDVMALIEMAREAIDLLADLDEAARGRLAIALLLPRRSGR